MHKTDMQALFSREKKNGWNPKDYFFICVLLSTEFKAEVNYTDVFNTCK